MLSALAGGKHGSSPGTQQNGPRQATATATVKAEAEAEAEATISPPTSTARRVGSTPTETAVPQQSRSRDKHSLDYAWRSGFAGGVAGCAAKTVVAPLDRVKILFQAHNPHFAKYAGSWYGVGAAIREIHQQDGVFGLFRGHSVTLLRILPYAAIKFLAYEQVRAVVIRSPDQETPHRRMFSGSLAGVTSVMCTYPLELIRVRVAFETKRGSHSSLRSICKQIYNEKSPPARTTTAPNSAQTTATTATAATTATDPALANVQNGLARTGDLSHGHGITNFYRGFSPSFLGMVVYAGVSFLTHDTAGDLLRHPRLAQWTTLAQPKNAPPGKAAPLRSWAELLSGGLAGLVSQTASYPLEIVRRRMQVGGAVGDGRRLRIGETARLIMREGGLRGFFVGLTIGYVKVVPMSAVSFFTYERLKTWLGI